MRPMTPAQSAVRAALEQPMLSEAKCRAVVLAVLRSFENLPSAAKACGVDRAADLAAEFSASYVATETWSAILDALIAQEGG